MIKTNQWQEGAKFRVKIVRGGVFVGDGAVVEAIVRPSRVTGVIGIGYDRFWIRLSKFQQKLDAGEWHIVEWLGRSE